MDRLSKKIERSCKNCNKIFYVFLNKLKLGYGNFCSHKCKGNTIEDFWNNIDKKSENECWEWKKTKDKNEYGIFFYKNKYERTHKFSYFLTHPEENTEENRKLFILHSCDNPPCCNPKHLKLGTHEENMRDMLNKNRQAKGAINGRAKLDEFDVKQILLLKNILKVKTIAEMYNVHWSIIYSIFNNKTWKHIPR